MHVLFIAKDLVFPTHDGGRLATRNDTAALAAAGATLSLLVVHRSPVTSDTVAQHQKEYERVLFVPQRTSKVRTSLTHPSLPYMSASRIPKSSEYERVTNALLQVPRIDCIVASQEYTLPIALALGRRLGAKVVLRSENNEVEYTFKMIANSPTLKRKAFLWSEGYRLSWALRRLLKEVDRVALISPADAPVYARFGAMTVVIPPTLTQKVRGLSEVPDFAERALRIAFVGSLDAPHTVAGLLWFAREVLPRIRGNDEDTELHVIGRGVSDRLRDVLASLPGVRVVGEVAVLDPLFDRARCFVNPIFQGSGVNMKLGPPAAAGLPIVSTTFGLRGLADLKNAVETADSPDGFAEKCSRLLHDRDHWMERASNVVGVVRSSYSAGAVAAAWIGLLENIGVGNPRDPT